MSDEVHPPIPASCAHRPTTGGLVIPVVNIRLADGGVDFRSPHNPTYARCWTHRLCQTCGNGLGRPAVLLAGPNQLADNFFDEPPLCSPCAVYASKACPMVAGRQPFYADRARVSEGRRGKTCSDPSCECAGVVPTDLNATASGGDPAHAWYALYVAPRGYTVTVQDVESPCPDQRCRHASHTRRVVNGGFLTRPPLKVVLASEPGAGRVWQRLTDAEAAALLPAEFTLPKGARLA
ncbi:hypothetical protein E1287_25715 [Actinomadura sp. KC06]|uniref:hypothetical protein n=1 Tax=Actinomadura sp. KC06 TaxID=2530369 RepID=UPI00104C16A9|nr:hypothetical protein [Actinomadura sp. KC06]TDD31661.1 hypothetical protein E1287_25715 [Actinomadura sp. KC06]